ncbi:fatty acid desaturase [Polaromonas sp. JS666]|uniref:fatty acid desaturase n=1 Tax=Polaromonas sp. (strain JS666 / ATCC BAA-500) TaxID=296591 RepID=UPI00031C75BE|nr:fatty acid desaturase [Polaromonas sp. JS666]
MKSIAIKNAGYMLVLLPQLLLVVGTSLGFPWLSVALFFGVLPIMRKFVGNDLSPSNGNPSSLLRIYLQAIPRLYFVAWALTLPWVIWVVATRPMSTPECVGFTLALWIVCSLNAAIAHELIHVRSRFDRVLGQFLYASIGYFHFPEEHMSHHARTGHYYDGDAAMPGTSVYVYAAMRFLRTFRLAWAYEAKHLKGMSKGWLASRMLYRAIIPVAIASAFYGYAGQLGLAIYLFQIIGAAFTVQVITYLQHWGLSERETPALADYGFSWEDGCWMQACVTLNHTFHGQHHLSRARPYYELGLTKDGLHLPASYPVMFVVALFPSLFSTVMKSRLVNWIENYEKREMLMHEADCIGGAKIFQTLLNGRDSKALR